MNNKSEHFHRLFRPGVLNCRRNLLPAALFFSFFALLIYWPGHYDHISAEPLEVIAADARCPVCGMFVAKYDVWITQIRTTDNSVYNFDGVKDMMAFRATPESFIHGKVQDISEIWVKDYYSLKWIRGESAFYVAGSDVLGPMGHELVPFASRAAAESFMTDHKGKAIYTFPEITSDLVNTLRSGHMMK
ncbi:MAG: nitrous oxide reductase accessory protein NosL [Proteobacteria bacterium]|nr:nitrous oxide reductase accessory protein NosL [Pseudomonadota bacterium]MBU1739370.1 nitrous oxide reductase accessory protein NosL [Pseudomonadota bacterium]